MEAELCDAKLIPLDLRRSACRLRG